MPLGFSTIGLYGDVEGKQMVKCKLCGLQRNVRADRMQYKKGYCSAACMRKAKFVFFYESRSWRQLRYDALKTHGRKCALCKTTEGRMHVDHIKPRSLFPKLELNFNNLQVLCEACNLGKGNRDSTDFRTG